MGQNREHLRRLRDYLSRTRGQRYPFDGHWLEGEDAYLQNAWLKTLCMLLQAAKDISEEQTLFLQRLVSGVKAEYEVETYMRQGLEVAPETLEEFIEQLLDDTEDDKDEKRYAFVLDALLLIHLGEPDDDADELLAQMCEALRFTPGEMEDIAGLCADVLRQDLTGSILHAWRAVGLYHNFLWSPYVAKNCGQTWKITEDVTVAADAGSIPFDISRIGEESTLTADLSNHSGSYKNDPCIKFCDRSYLYLRGLEISVDQHLFFRNIDTVDFEDCTFVGKCEGSDGNTDRASIWFVDCKEVYLTNCTFRGFKSRTVIAMNVQEIYADDCTFTDCIRTYYNNQFGDWQELGGVIYGDTNLTKLNLQRSGFTNCGGKNKYCYFTSSVISNCQAEIKDCRFEKCLHINGYDSVPDPPERRRCLFSHILSESGNELIDSAELGPH